MHNSFEFYDNPKSVTHAPKDIGEHRVRDEASLAGRKILLVEDNLVNIKLAAAMLELLGCEVETADNGKAALERLTAPNDIELILMDCQMPDMDGFEATRLIREMQKKGEMPALPIIALTANAIKGDRERCLKAGMDDYLAKSLHAEAFKSILLKWLTGEKRPLVAETEVDYRNVPCLDLQVLTEVRTLMSGKFGNALQLYFTDTDYRMDKIGEALAAKEDINTIVLQAHSIKSSSAHMGAARLSAVAGIMEMRAQQIADRRKDAAELAPLLSEMRKVFIETQEISARLNKGKR